MFLYILPDKPAVSDNFCNFAPAMTDLEILLLAVGLAMDCFTVSIASGVIIGRLRWRVLLTMSALFGFFQFMMPLIGWAGVNSFSSYLEAVDHWIAFGMLAYIGGKMVRDALSGEEASAFNPEKISTQLMLAVATSIDALAVGVSFSCIGYTTPASILRPAVVIGLVSSLFTISGFTLSLKFGRGLCRRVKPELLGGIILILIGVRVLVSHLVS